MAVMNTPGQSEGLWNMEQAAKYLGVKISCLYKLTMQRQIAFVKLGKLNRFRKQDLDEFILQNLSEVKNRE